MSVNISTKKTLQPILGTKILYVCRYPYIVYYLLDWFFFKKIQNKKYQERSNMNFMILHNNKKPVKLSLKYEFRRDLFKIILKEKDKR
jgi:hypothetical protein